MKLLNLVLVFVYLTSLCLGLSHEHRQENSFELPFLDINSFFSDQESIVMILPSHETNGDKQKQIHEYAKKVFRFIEESSILNDEEALKKDLSQNSVIVYGTPEGNRWLSKFFSEIPVKLERDRITLQKKAFSGNDLRFISLWANPENKKRAVLIYTAQKADDIIGINRVPSGQTQFVIAQNKQILESGFYKRENGRWIVTDIPYFETPQLTKEQMYEDYDFLVDVVKKVFPTVAANKKVYGIDVFENLKQYRTKIERTRSALDFCSLVNEATNSCKGSHFGVSGIRIPLTDYFNYFKGHVDERSIPLSNKYSSFVRIKNKGNDLDILFFYFTGNYYVQYDFEWKNRLYPKGLKLISLNGESIQEILSRYQHSMQKWDHENKIFYSNNLFEPLDIAEDEVLTLEFADMNGKSIKANFKTSDAITIKKPENRDYFGKNVLYLNGHEILYIRVPMMRPEDLDFYYSNIKQKAGHKNMKAIVIDIRNNPGGSDEVWRGLISHLSDKDYILESKLGIKDSELNSSYIRKHSFGKVFLENNKPEHMPFLDDEKFIVMTYADTIKRSDESINFHGTIYVLSDNVYSAAGSFVAFAMQADNVTSVGLRNPEILGIGIDPYRFSLPNSKIIFSIEPVIDLTNACKAEDVFHTDVEIEVHPTLDEMIRFYNAGAVSLEEFLLDYDPFFQCVLKIAQK
jgi:hypothetical protein